MEKGYFAAAWGDVVKTPGWGSILLRLGLLCLIPVFGIVVAYGYLYSWARDISWNVHRPMPAKIFGNEDGGLYKRGFFILVVTVVFSLVPEVFSSLASMLAGGFFVGGGLYGSYAPVVLGFFLWMVSGAASVALALLAAIFTWVGSMRVSLYGTLSSGFQLGKVWAMIRYDFIGLLRILGMNILIDLIILFGLMAVACFLLLICSGAIFLVSNSSSAFMFAITLLVVVGALFTVGVMFCLMLQLALTTRALGYWTRQFEVSKWNGQEDPMPFEQERAAASPCGSVVSGQESVNASGRVDVAIQTACSSEDAAASPIPNAVPGVIARPAPFRPNDGSVVGNAAAGASSNESLQGSQCLAGKGQPAPEGMPQGSIRFEASGPSCKNGKNEGEDPKLI